jgi:hypothetical protein
MFARFARIGVGHQIQYDLPNVTDDEIVVGSLGNDGEPLDEGDLETTGTGNIIESSVDDQQNQALEENTTDSDDSEDDEWDDDSEDEVTSTTDSDDETDLDDEDSSSEDYGESDDEGPDFKF